MSNEMNTNAAAVAEQAQAKVKEGMAKAMDVAAKAVTFGHGNLEALVKSAQIWAAGAQDLSKQAATTFQSTVQDGVSVLKTLGTVKSVKEAIDLQSGYVRTTLEKVVAESGRLTEASLKLAEQAMAPITERVRRFGEAAPKAV